MSSRWWWLSQSPRVWKLPSSAVWECTWTRHQFGAVSGYREKIKTDARPFHKAWAFVCAAVTKRAHRDVWILPAWASVFHLAGWAKIAPCLPNTFRIQRRALQPQSLIPAGGERALKVTSFDRFSSPTLTLLFSSATASLRDAAAPLIHAKEASWIKQDGRTR